MKENKRNFIKISTMRMATVFLIIFALFALSSCNAEYVSESKQSYYAYGVEGYAADDSSSGYVRIGFTADVSTENLMADVVVSCEKFVKRTFWFSYSKYVYNIDGVVLKTAVDSYITTLGNEKLENVQSVDLKVLYQYATIYKSTTTNGALTKQGKNCIHNWEFNQNEDVAVEIELRNEIRASWYTVIIGVALLSLAVFVPITIAASRIKKTKIVEETSTGEIKTAEEANITETNIAEEKNNTTKEE